MPSISHDLKQYVADLPTCRAYDSLVTNVFFTKLEIVQRNKTVTCKICKKERYFKPKVAGTYFKRPLTPFL